MYEKSLFFSTYQNLPISNFVNPQTKAAKCSQTSSNVEQHLCQVFNQSMGSNFTSSMIKMITNLKIFKESYHVHEEIAKHI
jgi:hypothetical protein